MQKQSEPRWLSWAREIQALGQTGLTFSENEFNTQRYHRLLEIAAEIISEHADVDQDMLLDNYLAQPGYATPKIDVRGAVLFGDKILLVQERSDEAWCMPGGWVDVGETPGDAIEREVLEESGLNVKARKVIGVFDANRSGRPMELYHAFKIVFLCEWLDGEPTSSNETLAAEFFDFRKLPKLSSNRTNQKHLAEVQAHLQDPERQTFFD